jgi:prepilin-type N-terminal cleavage/methylation domain-containing protein
MAGKGFTLVELIVVILIVAILAAVAIPIMRGRVDAAKWSEGKALMGNISAAIRAYFSEPELERMGITKLDYLSLEDLQIDKSMFEGKYFTADNFEIRDITVTDSGVPELQFSIIVENHNLYPAKLLVDESSNLPEPSSSTPLWQVISIFVGIGLAFYIFTLTSVIKPIAQLEAEIKHLKGEGTNEKEGEK